MENYILENNIDARGLLADVTEWEGVGKFSLHATDSNKVDRWRRCLASLCYGDFHWNSYPSEALVVVQTQVSLVLRSPLRNFCLKWLTHGLLLGNRLLRGRIDAKFCKTYTKFDFTRAGSSKAGWRLVFADVDRSFSESLKVYPPEYQFRLGSSSVQLRPVKDKRSLPLHAANSQAVQPAFSPFTAAVPFGFDRIKNISVPVKVDKSGKNNKS